MGSRWRSPYRWCAVKGESVIVERHVEVGRNAHNQPIYEWAGEQVENVLVAPGPRNDIPDTARPEGVIVAWTLYFPKTFTGDLEGARVVVRGQEPCAVIGSPQRWPESLTPTDWNLPAEVSRADG